MLAVARDASRAMLGLAALAAVLPCTRAHADVDLTGSWNVYVSSRNHLPSTVWDIVQQNGSVFGPLLTASDELAGGFPLTGPIDPQAGTFTVRAPDQSLGGCSTNTFVGTASADGNAFHGDIFLNFLDACPGGVPGGCCIPVSVIGTFSGCRIGTDADCCGDHVVGPTEQCDNGPEPATGCCDPTCQLRSSGSTCTSDYNACTDDVCDAAGICTHPPVGAGAPCPDGTACTTDACDATGTCVHTLVASGTPCEDDGHTCTADICDARGVCTHLDIDLDRDGVCDPFDLCVDGVAITRARLRIGRIGVPPGDDQLVLKGDMQVPASQPFDPIGQPSFLRLLLGDSGGVFLSVTVPPGAYSTNTHSGWTVRGTGYDFVSAQLVGDAVNRVRLRRPPGVPGVLRMTISGKGGSFARDSIAAPLEVTIAALSVEGEQCGKATFETTSCSIHAGNRVCH